MSWLDEAVSRRLQAQRDAEPAKVRSEANAAPLELQQQQNVEAFDPLVQRLLREYGEFVFAKMALQKHFIVRLERPGRGAEKTWNWHWHFYSLVKHHDSIEVHPRFTPDGMIKGFTLLKAQQRIEIEGFDEAALKEGLIALYLN